MQTSQNFPAAMPAAVAQRSLGSVDEDMPKLGVRAALGHAEGHGMGRLGADDGIDLGMLTVDLAMQRDSPAGQTAGLTMPGLHKHDICGLDVMTIHAVRSDQQCIRREPGRERSGPGSAGRG